MHREVGRGGFFHAAVIGFVSLTGIGVKAVLTREYSHSVSTEGLEQCVQGLSARRESIH